MLQRWLNDVCRHAKAFQIIWVCLFFETSTEHLGVFMGCIACFRRNFSSLAKYFTRCGSDRPQMCIFLDTSNRRPLFQSASLLPRKETDSKKNSAPQPCLRVVENPEGHRPQPSPSPAPRARPPSTPSPTSPTPPPTPTPRWSPPAPRRTLWPACSGGPSSGCPSLPRAASRWSSTPDSLPLARDPRCGRSRIFPIILRNLSRPRPLDVGGPMLSQ